MRILNKKLLLFISGERAFSKRIQITLALALFCFLFPSTPSRASDPDFTFVIFPDIQNMTQSYPDIWNSMCQWVVDHRSNENIQAVLTVGDITNHAYKSEFATAANGFKIIDNAGIPFVPIVGNHDYDTLNSSTRDNSDFNLFFSTGPIGRPETIDVTRKPWFGGNYIDDNANHYIKLDIGKMKFLILALELFPRPEAVDWASRIVDSNSDRAVIILTHGYLYPNGTRIPDTGGHGPTGYGLPARDNSGEDLWNNLLKTKQNICSVICGHVSDWGIYNGYNPDVGDNGNTVHQVFVDYQAVQNGGDGWIGLMKFHPSTGGVDLTFYRTWPPSGLGYDVASYSMVWPSQPPVVDAGLDLTLMLPSSAFLSGVISDDGLPSPPGDITSVWSKILGPGTVSFIDPSNPVTTASFSEAGTYILRLSASDSIFTVVDDVQMTVNPASNQPPYVSMGSPANGTIFAPSVGINLLAMALDPDGEVVKVEFYVEGNKVGEDTEAPFTTQWSPTSVGSYDIIAKAIDNSGLVSTSPPIQVIVQELEKEISYADNVLSHKVSCIRPWGDHANGNIKIYNAQGNRLLEATASSCWDGKVAGQEAAPGIYVWISGEARGKILKKR